MPLEDLGLEPQDGPKLIGFLKAMEFTTLTRRVAEACGCDASVIDAVNVPVEWGADARGPDLELGEAPVSSAVSAGDGADSALEAAETLLPDGTPDGPSPVALAKADSGT